MKEIYHYKKNKFGIKILQQDPIRRTLNLNGSFSLLNFPFLYFIVKYEIINEKYFYYGYKGCSLQVYYSNNEIKSFEDQIYVLPTERISCGAICTDHKYDDSSFDSLKELEQTMIGLWWQHNHNCENADKWRNNKSYLTNSEQFAVPKLGYAKNIISLKECIEQCFNMASYTFIELKINYFNLPKNAKLSNI